VISYRTIDEPLRLDNSSLQAFLVVKCEENGVGAGTKFVKV
jgi:hypothetical protein